MFRYLIYMQSWDVITIGALSRNKNGLTYEGPSLKAFFKLTYIFSFCGLALTIAHSYHHPSTKCRQTNGIPGKFVKTEKCSNFWESQAGRAAHKNSMLLGARVPKSQRICAMCRDSSNSCRTSALNSHLVLTKSREKILH